jgi:RsmE family RNA methyltransferase
MNLIFIDPAMLDDQGEATLTGRALSHAREVLRPSLGDTLKVGLEGGAVGEAEVLELSGAALRLRCRFDRAPPATPDTSLLLALPRPQTLKKVLVEATALGLKRLILVRARRTEKSYLDSKLLKDERYRDYLRLGLEQCGATVAPELSVHRRFRPLIEEQLDGLIGLSGLRILADLGGARSFAELRPGEGPVTLAIGPEGGWVPFERELLAQRGFETRSLGDRVLRVETATIAALAQIDLLRRAPLS